MKTLLFSLFGLLFFSFTSIGEIDETIPNNGILMNSEVVNSKVVTGNCTDCPEECCAIIISLENGGTRTIMACCGDIHIIRL